MKALDRVARRYDAQLVDLLRRERANFVNYKRRVERQRSLDPVRTHAAVVETGGATR